MALQAGKKRQLRKLEGGWPSWFANPTTISPRWPSSRKEIRELKRRIEAVPFIDTFDLKFNNFVKRPVPPARR